MNRKTLLLPALAVFLFANTAGAGDRLNADEARNMVQPFYDLLSNKGSVEKAKAAFHADWRSHYSAEGYKTLDQTMGFFTGPLVKMIPDINWKIVDVSVTDKNEIVVRGEGSGTPAGKSFFGKPVTGKSFKIMSIDIHQVKDGKIAKTYHIEDWAGAFKQLAAKPSN